MQQSTSDRTGWTAWIYFAAIMMFIVGSLQAIAGLAAIFNDEWVVWGAETAVLLDLTGWGWVHLLLGIVIVLSGVLVLRGSVVGRTVAVVLASISILINFLWLPVYPLWGVIMITIDVLVIYALIAHGREVQS